jgi:hypothetical protein
MLTELGAFCSRQPDIGTQHGDKRVPARVRICEKSLNERVEFRHIQNPLQVFDVRCDGALVLLSIQSLAKNRDFVPRPDELVGWMNQK